MAQEKWIIEPGEKRVIDLDSVRALKVGLVGGQVDVIGHDEPTARVEVHSVSGKSIRVEIDGDRLEVDHPQLRWDNFITVFRGWTERHRADVSILVPREIALKFGVVSASGLVSGLRTDASLSTVSGDLTVDGVIGDLELNAVSGEISVRDHSGRIAAHTVSGDVTVSGGVDSLSVDGVSGNVFADISGTPRTVTTNTVSGDLTLRLDANVGARYRINTVSGRLQFGGTVIRTMAGKGMTYSEGETTGPVADVVANSVSGNLSVLRRANAGAER